MRLRFTLNQQAQDVDVPENRLLIDLLREDLGLTGTKEACSIGVCGVCTVLVNGKMLSSCLVLAPMVDGADITTIEGIGSPEALTPVQRAFIDTGGFQCGICTPGQVISATALLAEVPRPTEEQVKRWMMGNLCRCTGGYAVVASVLAAAERGAPA